jgi:transposase InsO family protein
MSKKSKYDTSVVLLYMIGKEELLPASFRKNIPYSTIASWRKSDYTSYKGYEFRDLFLDHSDYLLIKKKYDDSCRLLRAITKTWLSVHELLLEPVREAHSDKLIQKQLVAGIDHLKKAVGLKKALKIFGISHTLYVVWSDVVKKNCGSSQLSLCVQKYPHQLHREEVNKIHKMLADSRWENWPIVSIAALALRNKNVIASLFSWYKYAKYFNIDHAAAKKLRRMSGLQAERPNEYLHLDTTYYQMNEMQRVCITFVMDNYSKMILGYSVSDHLSFTLVKEALAKALKVIERHPDQKDPFLVTDGGSENNNKEVNDFIRRVSGFRITKIRALKDIRFSNSPVEAIHKIMKGRYLRNARFDSIDSLCAFLEKSIYNYNQVRPHYKHSPQTPFEVYFNTRLDFNVHNRIKQAAKERVIKNKNSGCGNCLKTKNSGSCITHKAV